MPKTDNPDPGGHWFEALADHMGEAYHRYAFTKGTANETQALIAMLDLRAGQRILDVGCGLGRHSLALAEAGLEVVGIDISASFVELATSEAARRSLDNVTFTVVDARRLELLPNFLGSFDAAISLCQGAFGLAGGAGAIDELPARELDESILAGIAAALRPGGRLAVSAFSAYFQIRYLEDHDTFDARSGVNHETTEVRNRDGAATAADLWTTCFTPRELRLLARAVGLEVDELYGVTPGRYAAGPPSLDVPEFLLLARRPAELR